MIASAKQDGPQRGVTLKGAEAPLIVELESRALRDRGVIICTCHGSAHLRRRSEAYTTTAAANFNLILEQQPSPVARSHHGAATMAFRHLCAHPDSHLHFPTTEGLTLILSRYTELTAKQKLLVQQLKLVLPPQPPPGITAPGKAVRPRANAV
jgi:hypothetical protein